jgi:hypothetical protein
LRTLRWGVEANKRTLKGRARLSPEGQSRDAAERGSETERGVCGDDQRATGARRAKVRGRATAPCTARAVAWAVAFSPLPRYGGRSAAVHTCTAHTKGGSRKKQKRGSFSPGRGRRVAISACPTQLRPAIAKRRALLPPAAPAPRGARPWAATTSTSLKRR